MRKRIISAIIAVTCGLTSISAVYAAHPGGYDYSNAIKDNYTRFGEEYDWEEEDGESIQVKDEYIAALAKLESLGLASDSGWQAFASGETMTRAQFTSIAVGLVGAGAVEDYKEYFFDVKEGDDFASAITYAAEMGYVSGEGGLFRPDSKITYIEACAILVRLLGQNAVAGHSGGWFTGYVASAQNSDITDGVRIGDYNAVAAKGDLYIMLANTLESDHCAEISGIKDGYIEYTNGKTLLERYFGVLTGEGIITSVGGTGVMASVPADKIIIGGKELSGEYNDYIELLGYDVDYWYTEEDEELIFAYPHKNRNNVLFIDAADIIEGNANHYRYTNEKGTSKTVNLTSNATVIYNGHLASSSVPNLYTPELGYVKLVSGDGDSKYEYVIIESYRDVVVSVVNSQDNIIYGEQYINGVKDSFSFDSDDYEYFTFATTDGKEVVPSLMSKYDVVSLRISADGKYGEAILSQKSVGGVIERVSTEGNDTIVVIDGTEYHLTQACAREYATLMHLGAEVTLKLDCFGYAAAIVSGVKKTGLYAYVISERYDDEMEATVLKVVNENDKHVKLITGEKCKVDGKNIKVAKTINAEIRDGLLLGKIIKYDLDEETGNLIAVDTLRVTSEEDPENTLSTMYDSGVAEVKFKGSGNFGDKFYLDENSIVFTVYNSTTMPDNKKYRARTRQTLGNDKVWKVKAYASTKTFTAEAVIISRDVETTISSKDKTLYAVTDVSSVYDEAEGQPSRQITVTNGTKTVTGLITNEEWAEYGYDVEKGDLVTVDIEDGYVQERALVVEYDKSTGKFNSATNTQSGTYDEAEYKLMPGFVYEVRDNLVMICATRNNDKSVFATFTTDSSDAHVIRPSAFKMIRMRDGEVTMYDASAKELRGYKDSGSDCTRVVAKMSWLQHGLMYILDYDN